MLLRVRTFSRTDCHPAYLGDSDGYCDVDAFVHYDYEHRTSGVSGAYARAGRSSADESYGAFADIW